MADNDDRPDDDECLLMCDGCGHWCKGEDGYCDKCFAKLRLR